MSNNKLRSEVLSQYKKLLRLGKTWESANKVTENTLKEREFITSETKSLFRRNSNITNEAQIREHIKEANARFDIALHYRNPYPRPVNLPPMSMVSMSSQKWKKQKQIRTTSKPLYAKSIDIDDVKQ